MKKIDFYKNYKSFGNIKLGYFTKNNYGFIALPIDESPYHCSIKPILYRRVRKVFVPVAYTDDHGLVYQNVHSTDDCILCMDNVEFSISLKDVLNKAIYDRFYMCEQDSILNVLDIDSLENDYDNLSDALLDNIRYGAVYSFHSLYYGFYIVLD